MLRLLSRMTAMTIIKYAKENGHWVLALRFESRMFHGSHRAHLGRDGMDRVHR